MDMNKSLHKVDSQREQDLFVVCTPNIYWYWESLITETTLSTQPSQIVVLCCWAFYHIYITSGWNNTG